MRAHADLYSAFFLYLLISIEFRSSSIQSSHLKFGLLPSGVEPSLCRIIKETLLGTPRKIWRDKFQKDLNTSIREIKTGRERPENIGNGG